VVLRALPSSNSATTRTLAMSDASFPFLEA
jgi:hypothetical protein